MLRILFVVALLLSRYYYCYLTSTQGCWVLIDFCLFEEKCSSFFKCMKLVEVDTIRNNLFSFCWIPHLHMGFTIPPVSNHQCSSMNTFTYSIPHLYWLRSTISTVRRISATIRWFPLLLLPANRISQPNHICVRTLLFLLVIWKTKTFTISVFDWDFPDL